MTSAVFQRYVRVALYYLFGALATYGVTVPDNTKTLVLSLVGVAANIAWTIYGTKLSALLAEIQNKAGVNQVDVKVDPAVIDATKLAQATPAGVGVKTS